MQFYIDWTPGRNTLLHHNGDITFTDVTEGSGAEGMGIDTGVASGDINDDVDLVEVTWPNGEVQTLRHVEAGKTPTITEAD